MKARTPSKKVDVCVIGSGPAGALTAYKLSELGYDVVILEAGERFDFDERLERMERSIRAAHGPEEVWDMGGDRDKYSSSGDQFYPINRKRVKGVGGTSLHWGGNVWRMHPADFELQTRHGMASDWPIGYRDLKPYYREAEREMGVSGARDDPYAPPRDSDFPMPPFPESYSDRLLAQACASIGIESHPVPRAQNVEPYRGQSQCVGYGTCAPVCPSGAKYSADVHVAKAEDAGALVIDQAPVQRLHHDDSGDTITSAEYAVPSGETHHQEARAFVVACGGIETPRLLLLSQSDQYPDGLANSSGLVGHYFMEHPGGTIVGQIDQPTGQHRIGFRTRGSQAFYGHDSDNSGSINLTFLNTAGPTAAGYALRGGDSQPREDLLDPFYGDQWGDELLETIREVTGGQIGVSILTEQLPEYRNRVTLNTSQTDNRGNPVPDISWSLGSHVRNALRSANDIGSQILDQLGATNIHGVNVDNPYGPAHHMGTTRMGKDPTQSVVNPRLQTHDHNNLFIASSSVYVTGGAVNPTLTIAALALKTAEHLDNELRQS